MEEEFEDLHCSLSHWRTLLNDVYRIDPQKKHLNLYDVLNSSRGDSEIEKQALR